MPLATNPRATVEIVLEADRTDGGQGTIWSFRHLTAAEWHELLGLAGWETIAVFLAARLRAWANLEADADGRPITTGEQAMACCSPWELAELAGALLRAGQPSEGERKNSESPRPSATADSAAAAGAPTPNGPGAPSGASPPAASSAPAAAGPAAQAATAGGSA